MAKQSFSVRDKHTNIETVWSPPPEGFTFSVRMDGDRFEVDGGSGVSGAIERQIQSALTFGLALRRLDSEEAAALRRMQGA
jgi:hypothetical protein